MWTLCNFCILQFVCVWCQVQHAELITEQFHVCISEHPSQNKPSVETNHWDVKKKQAIFRKNSDLYSKPDVPISNSNNHLRLTQIVQYKYSANCCQLLSLSYTAARGYTCPYHHLLSLSQTTITTMEAIPVRVIYRSNFISNCPEIKRNSTL